MSRGKRVKAGIILSAIVPLVLIACTNPDDNSSRYQVPSDATPQSTALLAMGHIDTGFLLWGGTSIRVIAVDGQVVTSRYDSPPAFRPPALPVAPGSHAILLRAFRDPVAAYACATVTFEKGKTYTAKLTEPEMDSTKIWIEDDSTGQIVGSKYEALTYKEPLMSGAIVQLILAHPLPPCPLTATK